MVHPCFFRVQSVAHLSIRVRFLFAASLCLAVGFVTSLAAGAEPVAYPPPAQVKAAFLKQLDRPRVELDPRTRATERDAEGRISEFVSIASDKKTDGSVERVPLLIVRPEKIEGRLPAVIVLHGTGGNKESQRPFLVDLARRGIIGVAVDARYHGERSGGANGAEAYVAAITRAWKAPAGSPQEHPFYFDTSWDLWRTIDYLQTRADVDGSRLGMIGFSMGGIQTWLAAAVDERVKVAVPAISVQSFRWSLENEAWQGRANTIKAAHQTAAADLGETQVNARVCRELWNKVIPGMLDQFDCPSMIRLFAGRPLLILNGDLDPNCPLGGAKLAFATAEAAFKEAGATEKLKIMVATDTPHKVTDEQRLAALDWLAKWLLPAAAAAHASGPEKHTWVYAADLLRPFWKGNVVYGESVLFIRDVKTEVAKALVLFPVQKVLHVRNSAGDVTYEEGRDYVWKPDSREIVLPAGSRIVSRVPGDLRRPAKSQKYELTHRDGNGEILFGARLEYAEMQTCITYEHAGDLWKSAVAPPVPKYDPQALPASVHKLVNKQPLSIVLVGDSISAGANASGMFDAAPYQPAYPELLQRHLEARFKAQVELKNLAVGGTDTNWGLTQIDKVVEARPDLVILAFGMNDSAGRTAKDYGANSQAMIAKVREKLPDAEFILVASMLGNRDWIRLKHEVFPQYRDALASLCGPGIALADLTSIWTAFLEVKQDWDQTGNGVNHPNDFGHRVYAQVLATLLEPDTERAAGAAKADGAVIAAEPVDPPAFKHARVTDAWEAYRDRLTFGKGQTLALVDDGCNLSLPEWSQSDGEFPKVLVSYDSVDGDDDPKHEGKGYHGSTIGIPSSVNFKGKRGVAFNDQVAVIRALECCHCNVKDGETLAAGLQWIIDHHQEFHITAVNLAPVDDLEHAQPVPTAIDEKLAKLRQLGIWVSAPAGNHNFSKGISWPACQPNCFAIGAVVPGKDEVYLDRHAKIDLVVPAAATSSSNAIACGAVLLLREAIDKTGYDWKQDGANLPAAMLAILQKTGPQVDDPASGLSFRRIDVKAALDHVFANVKR